MKRVRCPKCDNYIIFDETKYSPGQSLVFKCNDCGKEFGIRIGVSKLKNTQKAENAEMADDNGQQSANEARCGRYQKGNPINTAFETVDPSVDLNHCTLTVSRDKRGNLRYTLADNNSNTGTFVGDVELQPRERRIIEDGTLFTLGATSIILRTADVEEDHT